MTIIQYKLFGESAAKSEIADGCYWLLSMADIEEA